MINLCGEMIVPQFGKYNYIHELDSRSEPILYWVRDSTAIFKKEVTLFINSKKLKVNEISRIDVIVIGDHGQRAIRFPMKLLIVMKASKNLEHASSDTYILCKKDYGSILKNTIIEKLHESFMLLLNLIRIDNYQVSIGNLCVTIDLAFF